MREIIQTAQDIEHLGIVGILAGLVIAEALILSVLWRQYQTCYKNLLRAMQGKEVDG